MFDKKEYLEKAYDEIDQVRNKGLSTYGHALQKIENLRIEHNKIYKKILNDKGKFNLNDRQALKDVCEKLDIWITIALKEGKQVIEKENKAYKQLIQELKTLKSKKLGSVGQMKLKTTALKAKSKQQFLKTEISRFTELETTHDIIKMEAIYGIPVVQSLRNLIRSYIDKQKQQGMINDFIDELDAQMNELSEIIDTQELVDIGEEFDIFLNPERNKAFE